MKKYLPFVFECLFLFYLMPLVISVIPLVSALNKIILPIINIFLLAFFSLFYSKKHGFSLLLPIFTIVYFVPAAFILEYSPMRLTIFSIAYAIVTFISELLGLMFKVKE